MSHVFDVVIVGGGPGGSTCATHLAEQGISVAVIERRHLQGDSYNKDKPCGGGLDGTVWRYLPRSIDVAEAKEAIVEHWAHTVVVRYGGRHEGRHHFDEPVFGLGMRRQIDGYFMQKAIDAGAQYIHGSVLAIGRQDSQGHRVQLTDGSALTGEYLVGADGSYSTVARALGFGLQTQNFVASEWETEVSDPEMWKRWEGQTLLDGAAFPGMGYCWIFPKRQGHLSLGWGIPKRLAPRLKKLTREVFENYGIDGAIQESAHHIPFHVGRAPVFKGKALLIGDAAGLANPTNGAGIWPAMASALWAADAIKASNLGHYQQRVDALFDDYRLGRAMRNYILFRMHLRPSRGPGDKQLWNWFCSDLQGKLSYHQWAKEFPWAARIGRFLDPLVDRLMVRSTS